ncbi:MAG: hypothetical protein LBH74_02480 [Nitrososphaerota archaeon]|jgi:hypothetical protein|nr:hypothetical protein [Nitrososphaerota archaeon]
MSSYFERREVYVNDKRVTEDNVSFTIEQRENALTSMIFDLAAEVGYPEANINDHVTAYVAGVGEELVKVFDGIIEQVQITLSADSGHILHCTAVDTVLSVFKNARVSMEFGKDSGEPWRQSSLGIQSFGTAIHDMINDQIVRLNGNPRDQNPINPLSYFATGANIGQDYIYGRNDPLPISYWIAKYSDGLTALTELVRLYGATSFKNSIDNPNWWYRGAHFISDPTDNSLLVALVGDHDRDSIHGKNIASRWPTYAPDLDLMGSVSFEFNTQVPFANVCLTRGTYRYPMNDDFSEGSASLWRNFWINNITGQTSFPVVGQSGFRVKNSENAVTKGEESIELLGEIGSPSGSTTQGWNDFKPANGWDNLLDEILTTDGAPNLYFVPIQTDFLKLITKDSPVNLNFSCYKKNNIVRQSVVLLNDFVGNKLPNGFMCNYTTSDDTLEDVSIEISYDDVYNGNKTRWVPRGQPDWNTIKYLGFTFRHTALFTLAQRSIYLDNINFTGNLIRGCLDEAIHNNTMTYRVGQDYIHDIRPDYKYPVRSHALVDEFAVTGTLDNTNTDRDSLYLTSLAHLLQYGSPVLYGTVMLPITTRYRPGQFTHVSGNNSDFPYHDDKNTFKTMRIQNVSYMMSNQGAFTKLELSNDLINGTVRSYNDYSTAMRDYSVDNQTRTNASLFGYDWDVHGYVVANRVKLPKIDL